MPAPALFVPQFLNNFWHLALDVLPDVAMILLALAGLGYLVPELLHTIEASRFLRSIVAGLFIVLGISVIVINHRERTAIKKESADARQELTEAKREAEEARKQTVEARQDAKRQFENLPNAIATEMNKYVRYTAPSRLSINTQQSRVPAPPTGLVAYVDGQVGTTATQLSREVREFLAMRGTPPIRNPGESDFDFVVRSNGWYANAMAKYNWQLKDRVITVVTTLIVNKAVDPRVAALAKAPENIMGIRALADQLDEGAKRFR